MAVQSGQTEVCRNPSAKYNKLSEKLRQVTPDELQCSMFCGGKKCKYESATCWDSKEMAINGLYSHWITDEILACARPNTVNIDKYNIIQQFQRNGIKSIFNLQSRGEHSSCTAQIHKSGFSYNPQVFMKQNNYGVASRDFLLDMVKVMAFALMEGKVAVHCHAGLGRTGVLIASYLIYSLRAKANDAIRYVRLKRPNSIQTSGQMLCIQTFAQFILPNFITFVPSKKYEDRFTLEEFLQRQSKILHGYDARLFKNIPKIVYIITQRLLQLCHCKSDREILLSDGEANGVESPSIKGQSSIVGAAGKDDGHHRKPGISRQTAIASSPQLSFDDTGSLNQNPWPETDDPDLEVNISSDSLLELSEGSSSLTQNACYIELNALKSDAIRRKLNCNGIASISCVMVTPEEIVFMFEQQKFDKMYGHTSELGQQLRQYQDDLNTRSITYELLKCETNAQLLVTLLCSWFYQLREPIFGERELKLLRSMHSPKANVTSIFNSLHPEIRFTVDFLARFVNQLRPLKETSRASLINTLARFLCLKTNEKSVETFCLNYLSYLQKREQHTEMDHATSIR